MPITLDDIRQLSVDERLELLEQIWETIAAEPDHVRLSNDQVAELDRRLDDYERDPEQGSPWEQVRERIENSL